jgi:mycoredoxin
MRPDVAAEGRSRPELLSCASGSCGYDGEMTVVLYSAPWCRDCREAKRFLEKNNIPFTEIDIESVPGAAAEVIRHVGKRAIPQLVIDGEWVQPYVPGKGFLYEEMSERLGLVR